MSAVSLPDVKAHLGIEKDDDDTELQAILDAAEAAIAHRVGPLAPTTVTVRVPGATGPLSLPVRPVISLTSVTPSYGGALDVTRLDVDPVTGLVAYQGYYSSFVSYFPMAWYSVVYQAGFTTLPADLVLAVKELVRHLWSPQRGPGRVPGPAVDLQPPAGYALPNRVLELLAPYQQTTFA